MHQQSPCRPFVCVAHLLRSSIQSVAVLCPNQILKHFLSDLHGEYDAFSHVLRNGSGAVRKKIDDVFGNSLTEHDKASLATLIYYPHRRMELEMNSVSKVVKQFLQKQQQDGLVSLLLRKS